MPGCTPGARQSADVVDTTALSTTPHAGMRGGRKKRLTPKYTPPSQARVMVENRDTLAREEREEGELEEEVGLGRVAHLMEELEGELREVGRGSTGEQGLLVSVLQGHLTAMQADHTKFLETSKVSGCVVEVDNTKYVLRTEEDVYNYFIR